MTEPTTEAGRALLRTLDYIGAHSQDTSFPMGLDDIITIEAEARAAPSDGTGSGTTTDCPLDGVHEHAFRGPHRFTEWYPTPALASEDRPQYTEDDPDWAAMVSPINDTDGGHDDR